MPALLNWFKRTFDFGYPVELYPDIIERLRGTPARAEDWARRIPPEHLTLRDGDTWSIQENLGHLLDLDVLHTARLDDFAAGVETLRAADLENRRTHEAKHNSRPIAGILADFRQERERFVARVEALPRTAFAQAAMHPRLKVPMRLVDMLTFSACHDDYHLARVAELSRLWRNASR